jgi:hypothetical protein
MMIRIWTWVTLFAGVVILCVPLFLPPEPVYPRIFSFLPYATLFAASCVLKSNEAMVLFVITLATVLIGGFVYLDTLRFNIVFSWQIWGLVTSFIPWFQLAACVPMVVWLLIRSVRRHNTGGDSVAL